MILNEIEILKYIASFRNDFLNVFFDIITMLGEESIMIILVMILYFAFDKKYAYKLFFICIMSLSINSILKNLIKLDRPFKNKEVTCLKEETATGYSFPSGHTQTFATISSSLAIKYKKIWFSILTTLLIILVAFSRMYLGAHYLSDVITGALLGVIISVIGSKIYDKFDNKRKLYLILLLILTPFTIFFLINKDPLYNDFFKVYGTIIGLFLAIPMEEKYGKIDYNVSRYKKAIRVIFGVMLAYILKEATKLIDFEILEISLLMSTIRYIIIIFVVLGIYPIIIRKFKI